MFENFLVTRVNIGLNVETAFLWCPILSRWLFMTDLCPVLVMQI